MKRLLGCTRNKEKKNGVGAFQHRFVVLLFVEKLADGFVERTDVFKLAVDRGEAHVGDFVDFAEFIHRVFADAGGGDFTLQRVLQLGFDIVHRFFQVLQIATAEAKARLEWPDGNEKSSGFVVISCSPSISS